MIIGAQMYTLRENTQTPQDMKAILKKVREIGYTNVQLSGQNADIPAADMAAWCAELGLDIGATHIPYRRMLDDLPGVIEFHKTLGCAYPGIGGMPGEYTHTAEGFATFAKQVNVIARSLRDAGMTFIYHNHHHEYVRFGDRSGMDILFEEFSPEVHLELDTHWVQAGGASPAAWIQKAAGRCDIIHFKDMTYDPEAHCGVICEAGYGNLDWPGIFEACKASGVKIAFIEQDDDKPKRPRLESLEMSFRYMKEKLG